MNNTKDTFDADKCAYSSAAMGICGAVRDHHGSGGPILYHAFVPPKRTVATFQEPSKWTSVRLIRIEAEERDEPERSDIHAMADRLEEILNRE